MSASDVAVDPAKASAYLTDARADIDRLRAIAEWAQDQAEDAYRTLHVREGQLREMLRVLAERGWTPTEHTYTVADGPKMLQETLCVAQGEVNRHVTDSRRQAHSDRLQRLMDECDRKRPVGPDCKHGERHTPECGCDDRG